MSEILVGQYLFRRLKQLGVDTIFGVPGGTSFPDPSITYTVNCVRFNASSRLHSNNNNIADFELALLDLVPTENIDWIGTPNELVGAYAADGYAREKGFGAVITTFGPGELSALCGLGGAYCEYVPVLHIVGYPTIKAQASGLILHHTLGDMTYEYVMVSPFVGEYLTYWC